MCIIFIVVVLYTPDISSLDVRRPTSQNAMGGLALITSLGKRVGNCTISVQYSGGCCCPSGVILWLTPDCSSRLIPLAFTTSTGGDYAQAGHTMASPDIYAGSNAFECKYQYRILGSQYVPLILFCSKLIHPAKLSATVLARDITHHMAACQHHSVLYFRVNQVHYFVEQKCSP